MEELAVRTPQVIAVEINSIKDQTKKIMMASSIEIGRRLVEAKGLIDHGEWGEWLEKSVEYSQRTANNLMAIFKEYGSNQMALFGNNVNSQALANLSYTQAVALLGIPADEREQFVEEHDLDNMSTRELAQAIKERDLAIEEKETLKARLENTRQALTESVQEGNKFKEEVANLRSEIRTTDQVLNETKGTVKMLQQELEKERQLTKSEVDRLVGLLNEAKANGTSDDKVQQLETQLKEARQKVEELTDELNKPVILEPAVLEKVPDEVERELEELRKKTHQLEAQAKQQGNETILKFRVQFDSLVKGFGELLGTLAYIDDREAQENFKGAVLKLLAKMQERIC